MSNLCIIITIVVYLAAMLLVGFDARFLCGTGRFVFMEK